MSWHTPTNASHFCIISPIAILKVRQTLRNIFVQTLDVHFTSFTLHHPIIAKQRRKVTKERKYVYTISIQKVMQIQRLVQPFDNCYLQRKLWKRELFYSVTKSRVLFRMLPLGHSIVRRVKTANAIVFPTDTIGLSLQCAGIGDKRLTWHSLTKFRYRLEP